MTYEFRASETQARRRPECGCERYSRLMSMDEEATVRMLSSCKQAMGDLIGQYGGVWWMPRVTICSQNFPA